MAAPAPSGRPLRLSRPFTAADYALTPTRSKQHTDNFITALIHTAQNGFGRDVEPFLALSRETWGEEILFDAVKDLPHGELGFDDLEGDPFGKRRTRLMYAAQAGDLARVKWLLARGARVELEDWKGRTALWWASASGRIECVHELVQRGAAVDAATERGSTPLSIASGNGHLEIVRELLSRGAAVNAGPPAGALFAASPLHMACGQGHLEVVRELLARGAAVDAAADDCTPLMVASSNSDAKLVRLLLERGAQVAALDWAGETVLHAALRFANPVQVSLWDDEKERELQLERKRNCIDTVKELLLWGADPDAPSHDGTTLLHLACGEGFLELVLPLLARAPAAIDAVAPHGTPLYYASCRRDLFTPFSYHREGNPDVVRALLDRGASVDGAGGETPLLGACKYKGGLAVVQELLSRGANANVVGDGGETPLLATINSDEDEDETEIVKVLLAAGAAVDAANAEGITPLDSALRFCQFRVVEALLAGGATMVDVLSDGTAPLMVAIQAGRSNPAVIALLARGANVNAADRHGTLPLHAAIWGGSMEVVGQLLAHGAAVDAAARNGATALHAAVGARQHRLEVLRMLLARGAAVGVRDHAGRTPLHYACRYGWVEGALELVARGASPRAVDSRGATPLAAAQAKGVAGAALAQLSALLGGE